MLSQRGFTLVEILVVVTIVGILAAIVIPQYQSNTNDAKLTCLNSNLHAIRKQIELYKTHHDGELPAAVGDSGDDFIRRMTTQTDVSVAAGTSFGPYQCVQSEQHGPGRRSGRGREHRWLALRSLDGRVSGGRQQ